MAWSSENAMKGCCSGGVPGCRAVRVQRHHGVGGVVVGHVGQGAGVQDGVVAQVAVDAQPAPALGPRGRRCPPWPRSNMVLHESCSSSAAVGTSGSSAVWTCGASSSTWNDDRDGEDGADRLAGGDGAGHERAAVADPVDLVADRLGVVAPADEVGVQRVDPELRVDGGRPPPAGPGPRSGRRRARPTGSGGRCRRRCPGRAAPGPASPRSRWWGRPSRHGGTAST